MSEYGSAATRSPCLAVDLQANRLRGEIHQTETCEQRAVHPSRVTGMVGDERRSTHRCPAIEPGIDDLDPRHHAIYRVGDGLASKRCAAGWEIACQAERKLRFD